MNEAQRSIAEDALPYEYDTEGEPNDAADAWVEMSLAQQVESTIKAAIRLHYLAGGDENLSYASTAMIAELTKIKTDLTSIDERFWRMRSIVMSVQCLAPDTNPEWDGDDCEP